MTRLKGHDKESSQKQPPVFLVKDAFESNDRDTDATELESSLESSEEEVVTYHSSFQNELNYEGYRTIEESDNDAYNSRELERIDPSEDELHFEDREESSETGEESVVDPQENRR